MRIFKISKDIEIVCNSESTRSGFRHLATLFVRGTEQEKAKCTYLNRTWERYEFQSVLSKVVEKAKLSKKDNKICREFIDGDQTDWSDFKMVKQIAMLGDVFTNNQKDNNNWKTRMLKAGFEKKGLIIPDDWDTLDEETKKVRLDKVIELMNKTQ